MDQNCDIDSLFESAASGEVSAPVVPASVEPTSEPGLEGGDLSAEERDLSNQEVFQRVGSLTRTLHDALRALGYDQHIQHAVGSLPDARARLSYIADLTGNAAEKVLTVVDVGMAAEESISQRAQEMASKLGTMQQPSLRAEAHEFAREVETHSRASRDRLTDIMMAQDFHDLTGQVIKKVADVAYSLEQQLVKLLLDMTPLDQRQNTTLTQKLEGPVIDKSRSDVVTNQEQVDDLLESLGF